MYIILKNGTQLVCKLGYAIKREIRSLIPGRARSISFVHRVHIDCGTDSMGTGRQFTGSHDRRTKVTTFKVSLTSSRCDANK